MNNQQSSAQPNVTLTGGQVEVPSTSVDRIVVEERNSNDDSNINSSVDMDEYEPSDIVETVVKDFPYEERIQSVADILGTDLPTIKKRSANFALSVVKSKESGKEYLRLPASANFPDKFKEYIEEASAAEGSYRQRNPKNRYPLEIGAFPKKPKIKMEYYEIGDRPWIVLPSNVPKEMFVKSLYPISKDVKSNPDVFVKQDKIKDWEEMARENISILSHLDHFIAASSRLFELLYDKLDRDEAISNQTLFNVARQGVGLMHSAGLGIQDLTRNSVWTVGETVLARQDVYLRKIKNKIPEHISQTLRFGDLNMPYLFDPEKVKEAEKAAEAMTHDKAQDKLVSTVTKMAEKQSTSRQPVSRAGQRYPKQSFQNMAGSDRKDKGSESKQYEKKPYDNQSNRGGRGGRGGGRGKYQQQSFRQYNKN